MKEKDDAIEFIGKLSGNGAVIPKGFFRISEYMYRHNLDISTARDQLNTMWRRGKLQKIVVNPRKVFYGVAPGRGNK